MLSDIIPAPVVKDLDEEEDEDEGEEEEEEEEEEEGEQLCATPFNSVKLCG